MADSAPPARPPCVSRRGIGAVIGTVLLLVSAIWAVLGVVIAPVLPGGWWGVAALAALVAALPLALLIRQRVAGRYPGRWLQGFDASMSSPHPASDRRSWSAPRSPAADRERANAPRVARSLDSIRKEKEK